MTIDRRATPLAEALRSCRSPLASAFILSVFVNMTLFAAPLYSMQIYDRVLTSRNLGTLAMLTLIVAVFVGLYGFLEYVRAGVLVRAGVRFHEELARPTFEAAMRAQLAGRHAAAAQASRDADTLRDALSTGTVSTLFDVPWTPIFVGVCYLIHSAMGLVAVAGAVLIFACTLLMEVATKEGVARATRHAGEATQFLSSTLRNAEVVRGLGMELGVLERWSGKQLAMIGAQAAASERGGALLAVSKVVRMGVQIALIGVGAWLAINRLISPGMMMAAMIIMARALAPVEQAVANWKRIVACRAAKARLEELFANHPAPRTPTELPAPRGDVTVENLTLMPARAREPVLSGVGFVLEAGVSVAVIGASGSGKSSLARALAGIWPPARGAVRLDGAALTHWDPTDLGRHIGYLPQEIEFFAGTVAENIARLGDPDGRAVIAAAKSAGVHEAVLRLPQGYETPIGDGEMPLSGGMRQRLALARALYGDPRLLVLDEPNSNLDSDGEAALAESIARMKAGGRTVVVITHKPQLLAHVDRILVLAGGRVQAFGERAEILARLNAAKLSPLMRDARQPEASNPMTRAPGHRPTAPPMAAVGSA